MKPLIFLLRCNLKNGIKQLTKKKGALIGYIVWFALISFGSLSMLFNKGASPSAADPRIYVAAANVLTMLIVVPSLLSGLNGAGLNFKMADVNLLFPSPLTPGMILLYNQVKQMGTVMVVSLFMLIQAPMLNKFFGITGTGILIYFTAWLVQLLTVTFINMFIYAAFGRRRESIKAAIRYTVYVLLLGFAGYAFYSTVNNPDPIDGLLNALTLKLFNFVPVVGWYAQLFASAVTGFGKEYFYALTAVAVTAVTAGWYALKYLGTDYYEAAMATAEKMADAMELVKKGENSAVALNRGKKVKQVEHTFTLKGAGAIFQKQMLEYRKTGFVFINTRTFIMSIAALAVAYLVPSTGLPDDKPLIALAITVYLSLIFSFQGVWARELVKPYIYLIPDGAYKKLIYSTLSELLKHLTDGAILFTLCTFIFRTSILSGIFCVLAYAVFNMLFCFTDIISRRVFGSVHSKILGAYAKMFFAMLVVIPGIVLAAILLYLKVNTALVLGLLVGVNLIIAALLSLLASSSFKNPEVNA